MPSTPRPDTADRAAGRPRSERARAAILAAAFDLVTEGGLAELSVEAIASRAGTSKATIYRWWPNKGAVALDALLDRNRGAIDFADTGDLRADLSRELRAVGEVYANTPSGAALKDIIGHAQSDGALATDLRERVIDPARDAAKARLERSLESGQLRAGLDLDLAVNALWGPLYHRVLVTGEPVTPEFVEELLDLVLPALLAPPTNPSAGKAAKR